jgi:allantoicase
MSDGWETRRSQHQRGKYAKDGPLYGVERSEWAIIKFGAGGKGVVRFVEVDTAFHPGNYPVVSLAFMVNVNRSRVSDHQACKIEATLIGGDVPDESTKWTTIVEKKPLGPHRQHYFDVERSIPLDQVFSHIRYSVYPGTSFVLLVN